MVLHLAISPLFFLLIDPTEPVSKGHPLSFQFFFKQPNNRRHVSKGMTLCRSGRTRICVFYMASGMATRYQDTDMMDGGGTKLSEGRK